MNDIYTQYEHDYELEINPKDVFTVTSDTPSSRKFFNRVKKYWLDTSNMKKAKVKDLGGGLYQIDTE